MPTLTILIRKGKIITIVFYKESTKVCHLEVEHLGEMAIYSLRIKIKNDLSISDTTIDANTDDTIDAYTDEFYWGKIYTY